jgi:hypothetical protein
MYCTITIDLFKGLKKIVPIGNLGESGSRFSITNISANSKPKSNGSKCSVTDLCQTDLCKNPRKSASLLCPFNGLTQISFVKNLLVRDQSSFTL